MSLSWIAYRIRSRYYFLSLSVPLSHLVDDKRRDGEGDGKYVGTLSETKMLPSAT